MGKKFLWANGGQTEMRLWWKPHKISVWGALKSANMWRGKTRKRLWGYAEKILRLISKPHKKAFLRDRVSFCSISFFVRFLPVFQVSCVKLCGIFNFLPSQIAEMWDLKMWDFIKSVLRFYTCFLWGCVYNPNSLTLR